LLVSHAHLNHSNDLNAVIDAMTYSGLDKKGVLVSNKVVVNGNDEYLPTLSPYYRDFLERFIVLEPGQRVGINEIEVLALKTKHSDPHTIGFKFFTPYFTLAYSSDTRYSSELIEEYKNSNILILNVPSIKKEKSKDNLCVEDAIKIIRGVNPRLAIIQHFGMDMLKADTLYQIREIQKATDVQTIAAKDGMVINPLSYSVDRGQRTLMYPKKQNIAQKTIPEDSKQSSDDSENSSSKEPLQEESTPEQEILGQEKQRNEEQTPLQQHDQEQPLEQEEIEEPIQEQPEEQTNMSEPIQEQPTQQPPHSEPINQEQTQSQQPDNNPNPLKSDKTLSEIFK
jgi:phosphoribosyl 1,2-cyclic phosphodiesterase